MTVSGQAFSNAMTFYDVPEGWYPVYDEMRDHLIERALNGEDVYAYHPVGNENVWNLWIDGERHDLRVWVPR